MFPSGAANVLSGKAEVATPAMRAPHKAMNFGMLCFRSEKRPWRQVLRPFPKSAAYAELEGGPNSLRLIAYPPVKRTRGIRREKEDLLFRPSFPPAVKGLLRGQNIACATNEQLVRQIALTRSGWSFVPLRWLQATSCWR